MSERVQRDERRVSERVRHAERRVSERIQLSVWSAGWTLVRRAPEPVVRAAFTGLADLAWARRGPGVAQLERNLARVLGPGAAPGRARELSRAGMRSYLRYWSEVFRLPDYSEQRIRADFRIVNEATLWDHLDRGRGVVVGLPHMGNWDLAGAWAAVSGMPVTSVAERLRPEGLYQRFLAYRTALGMEILPLTGAERDVFAMLVERLRSGRLVPLLADRDLRASGVAVTLLGEPTRMPPGPALLSLSTGAPLVPATLWYDEDTGGVSMRLHEVIPVPVSGDTRAKVGVMTQALADTFAEGIRAHPGDWHMLQPLWLADLSAGRGERAG